MKEIEEDKPASAETLLDSGEIEFDLYRSSGPGGQKVNKVSTAVRLRFNVAQSQLLPQHVKDRLERIVGRRMTKDGILLIEAQRFRTQEENRQDAIRRLLALIHESWEEPIERKETRPSAASKAKRLRDKRRWSRLKQERQKGTEIDE